MEEMLVDFLDEESVISRSAPSARIGGKDGVALPMRQRTANVDARNV